MSERTLEVWVGGEHYVFHDAAVDDLMELGRRAASPPEAWDALVEYAERHGVEPR